MKTTKKPISGQGKQQIHTVWWGRKIMCGHGPFHNNGFRTREKNRLFVSTHIILA